MNDSTSNRSNCIIETDEESFERDVFERSKETPVVVDFWAAWCGPCRMLAPVLEDLTRDYDGRFVLVKADTDRVPQAASRLNVQGIPAVFGFYGGEVVDFFQGALPPDQVRFWLDRLLLSAQAIEIKQLEDSDPSQAEIKYREILQHSPNESAASVGLARVLAQLQRFDEANQIIIELEKRGFLEAEAEKVKATVQLRGMKGADVDEARTAARDKPDDQNVQLELAEALAAAEHFQEAMDVCLAIIQKDKTGAGERARQVMVDIFRVLPDEDLVRQYRRKLSTILY